MTLAQKKELWKKATHGEWRRGTIASGCGEDGIIAIADDGKITEIADVQFCAAWESNQRLLIDSPNLLPLVEALEAARMSLSAIEHDMELPLRIRQSVIGSLDAARAVLAALEDA